MGQQRPGHASHLVGKCHRHDLEGPPRQELREPEIFLRILLGAPQDGMRADDKNAPQMGCASGNLTSTRAIMSGSPGLTPASRSAHSSAVPEFSRVAVGSTRARFHDLRSEPTKD